MDTNTVDWAEGQVTSATEVLKAVGLCPTRLLVSVPFFALLKQSRHYNVTPACYRERHCSWPYYDDLAISVTSTNPTAAFVTAYSDEVEG